MYSFLFKHRDLIGPLGAVILEFILILIVPLGPRLLKIPGASAVAVGSLIVISICFMLDPRISWELFKHIGHWWKRIFIFYVLGTITLLTVISIYMGWLERTTLFEILDAHEWIFVHCLGYFFIPDTKWVMGKGKKKTVETSEPSSSEPLRDRPDRAREHAEQTIAGEE